MAYMYFPIFMKSLFGINVMDMYMLCHIVAIQDICSEKSLFRTSRDHYLIHKAQVHQCLQVNTCISLPCI